MPNFHVPVFLARAQRDADDLVAQLAAARVESEIYAVIVGKDRPGWQVQVGPEDADRARSIATVLELQRYGNWEDRLETESFWGVVEDQSHLHNPTKIYSAQSVMQAFLLKNLLADQGIMAVVDNQVLQGASAVDMFGTPTPAAVLVPAEHAAAARELALDFDAQDHSALSGFDDDDASDVVHPWPTCPECGAKRTTRCPICKHSGTDFAEADHGFLGDLAESGDSSQGASCGCSGGCSTHGHEEDHGCCGTCGDSDDATEQDPEVMLMCSVCDEPFEPEYPRHCEWCGHEFEDGYVIEQIVGPEQISSRAIAVAVGLGLLFLAGMAYFVFVLAS